MLIVIAIAEPFSIEHKRIQGDPRLTILVDNSTSCRLFDNSILNKIKSSVEDKIDVSLKYIAQGDESPIADGVLNFMQGNSHVLLISDGNNNKGTELADVVMLASSLNTTISAVKMEPVHSDLILTVDAPPEVIFGTETPIYIEVDSVGPTTLNYHITVLLDDEIIIDEDATGKKVFEYKEVLQSGYHRIKASINADDFFSHNNVYYKTIRVLPKPKILFVTQKDSEMVSVLSKVYDITVKSYLPDNLTGYDAVIIYNIDTSWLNPKLESLTKYIIDGNGLVVIGGENSFDRGNYKNSLFETILPVKVGRASRLNESDMNVVIVIDVSGTTESTFTPGSMNSKIDVEKTIATQIIGGLKEEDKVGVVSFDFYSHLISPLSELREKPDLNYTIARIKSGGFNAGTLISAGLIAAEQMLRGTKGSKNVVVISDGITQLPEDALMHAKLMKSLGIKTYTIGVGFDTDRAFMRELALAGGGVYFEPKETEHIKLLFHPVEEEGTVKKGLVVVDSNHFITNSISLNARITGYNQVVPKQSARMLVSTSDALPILSVWYFGLGRVVTISTDPETWATDLLKSDNSKILTRAINWAIGDPTRNREFDVKVSDVRKGDVAKVTVFSDSEPILEGYKFSKIGNRIYYTSFIPHSTGFYNILGASMAVNYRREYESLGFNPELVSLVGITGGKLFDPNNSTEISEFVIEKSYRTVSVEKSYSWIFIIAALLILLTEICVRRIFENR